MALSDQPYREIETLRERLSRLGATSRRINESLDLVTFSGRCVQTKAKAPAETAGALRRSPGFRNAAGLARG